MILSKVLSKFQITLPKEAVRALGVHKGDVLKCTVDKGRVSFAPVVMEEAYSEEDIKLFYKMYSDPSNRGKRLKGRREAMDYLKSLHAKR